MFASSPGGLTVWGRCHIARARLFRAKHNALFSCGTCNSPPRKHLPSCWLACFLDENDRGSTYVLSDATNYEQRAPSFRSRCSIQEGSDQPNGSITHEVLAEKPKTHWERRRNATFWFSRFATNGATRLSSDHVFPNPDSLFWVWVLLISGCANFWVCAIKFLVNLCGTASFWMCADWRSTTVFVSEVAWLSVACARFPPVPTAGTRRLAFRFLHCSCCLAELATSREFPGTTGAVRRCRGLLVLNLFQSEMNDFSAKMLRPIVKAAAAFRMASEGLLQKPGRRLQGVQQLPCSSRGSVGRRAGCESEAFRTKKKSSGRS